ncbi:MAG: hypothetical protein P4L57_01345 [Rhizomicrobium sp.]|nr:hypothetical protein [Rhizomicrobium sp.]
MWKRLVVINGVMIADLYILLFVRVVTHVTITTLPGAHLTAEQAAQNTRSGLIAAAGFGLFVVLGICVWLNFRIIRRYRKAV